MLQATGLQTSCWALRCTSLLHTPPYGSLQMRGREDRQLICSRNATMIGSLHRHLAIEDRKDGLRWKDLNGDSLLWRQITRSFVSDISHLKLLWAEKHRWFLIHRRDTGRIDFCRSNLPIFGQNDSPRNTKQVCEDIWTVLSHLLGSYGGTGFHELLSIVPQKHRRMSYCHQPRSQWSCWKAANFGRRCHPNHLARWKEECHADRTIFNPDPRSSYGFHQASPPPRDTK